MVFDMIDTLRITSQKHRMGLQHPKSICRDILDTLLLKGAKGGICMVVDSVRFGAHYPKGIFLHPLHTLWVWSGAWAGLGVGLCWYWLGTYIFITSFMSKVNIFKPVLSAILIISSFQTNIYMFNTNNFKPGLSFTPIMVAKAKDCPSGALRMLSEGQTQTEGYQNTTGPETVFGADLGKTNTKTGCKSLLDKVWYRLMESVPAITSQNQGLDWSLMTRSPGSLGCELEMPILRKETPWNPPTPTFVNHLIQNNTKFMRQTTKKEP